MSAQATPLSQCLTFRLDEELFALDINKVREVLEFQGLTRVPRTPEFMRGVINVRGNVVPIVDLKLKLGLGRTEKTVDTRVVVAEVLIDGETVVVGALADSVHEVIDIEPSQLCPPPQLGTRIQVDCILSMGKLDGYFLLILDIDRILTSDDLQIVKSARSSSAPGTAVEQTA